MARGFGFFSRFVAPSFRTLRVRLLFLTLLAIIPAFGLIFYMAAEQRRIAALEAQEGALRLARLVATEQRNLIQETRQLLVVLAATPHVRNHDANVCSALAEDLLDLHSRYANVGAAKPNGTLFCSARPFSGRVNVAGRLWFRRAVETGEFATGDHEIDRATGKTTVSFGSPLLDGAGRALAVVFASVDSSWLNPFTAEGRLPDGATLTVFDRTGRILARHPDPGRWVGRSARETAMVDAALARQAESTAEAPDLDGVRRLFAFTPLRGGLRPDDLYVSIGIPQALAFSEANRTVSRALGGLGLVAALTLAAAWFGGDVFVLRRVNALLRATQRLAVGDLGVRAGVPYGQGELGQLARAFDELAGALQARQAEAERAGEVLRRSERHFRALIENALDIITVLDADGTIRYESPSVERVLGYAPEELIGRNALDLIHPEDVRAVRDLLTHRDQGRGSPASVEFRFRHKNGSWRVIEGIGRNLLDEAEVAGVIVNARDITELQVRRAALFQTEKLAAMGQLLAGVAHELNNPLAAIVGWTSILGESARGSQFADPVDKIGQAAERCARIVKNFLSLARERPTERQPVALNQVVQEGVELLAYPLRLDNVEVKLDLAPDLPILWADPHQLHQVVVNLVSNAHQAMCEAPTPRRLRLTTQHDPPAARVFLEVADSGPGIPAEIQSRIFEPFFTTKPLGQGTGLGLSLCHGIVEAHGGTIRVKSEPGRGTAFLIELPVEPPLVGEIDTRPRALPAPASSRTILVVDDEADVAESLAAVLRMDGHEVEIAANGRLALEKLQARRYDLIVSDVKMPGLDGPGLYRALRRRDPELLERFVFLTGDALRRQTIEFLKKTGAPTLGKPFSLDEVRRLIASTR